MAPGPVEVAAPPEGAPLDHVHLRTRIINGLAIIIPFAGLVLAIALLWGWGFSWVHLGLLLGGYLLTGIGVTVGYHRLFTHKSFETNVVCMAIFGVLGSMAAEGSILRWAALHRRHHRHSDRYEDPHSPHTHGEGVWATIKGLYHAHMGWLLTRPPTGLERYVPDLRASALVRALSILFPLWVVLGLLIPAAIGLAASGSWRGALLGLIWGGLVRVFVVHHMTWSVNSICHIWGTRPFDSHDHSRNNPLFGVIGFGEGWHNNHHAFPASARHGLRWWEFDASYLIIRTMAILHLARAVRVPSPERVEAKRVRRSRPGDSSTLL